MDEEPRFDHNSEMTHEGQTRRDKLVRYQAEKRIAAELVAEMLGKTNTPDTSPPRFDHDYTSHLTQSWDRTITFPIDQTRPR
jgi:hypothetical protein